MSSDLRTRPRGMRTAAPQGAAPQVAAPVSPATATSSPPPVSSAHAAAPSAAEDQAAGQDRPILIRLDQLLKERTMTMTELSARTGITMANLSVLKTNKAKAIRMTTLASICRALDVTPGDLLALSDKDLR